MRFLVFCLAIFLQVDFVSSCHSVKIFPNIPALNDVSSFFSRIPLFSALAPPVHRDNVIRTGKCAGGEIKIVTKFIYSNDTIKSNMKHMDHELNRLQKYSGIYTSEFCPVIEKTPVEHAYRFAVIYKFKYLTSTCNRVRLFVRNAVSWSSEILRARVACECDKVVEMSRA